MMHQKNIVHVVSENYCKKITASGRSRWRFVSKNYSWTITFVHGLIGNSLIVNHGKNTVSCNIHDVPKNYYLNNCKNNHGKSTVTCTIYDAPKKYCSRCIGKLL
jgi:hypothetical protein